MPAKLVRFSSLFTIILLMLASMFPLYAAYYTPPFLNDDSYITLAYAKNLANGHGFVFNHPPAVLGTTTPLFTMIVAGLALIFHPMDISVISVFLTAGCWLGIAWLFFVFRTAWGLTNWQVCIVALVVIASGWIGVLGMEAYLFAFLLFLSFSIFFCGRYFWAGLIVGLLFLSRGEGVLVLAVLLMAASIQDWSKRKSIDIRLGQRNLELVVGFALPVLLWAIYSQSTFGSFLPNTLAAKQAQGQTHLWRPFFQRLTNEWIPSWGEPFKLQGLPFVNLWWVIVLIGCADVLLRKRTWLVLAGWIILYALGYTWLNVATYWWYQFPIVFALNVFFGLGLITIVEALMRYFKPPALSVGASVVLIILLVFILAQSTFDGILSYQGDARGTSYTALSRWFREHTEPSESIAFIEIGYLGYYTDNRIIDLAGLVLPDIVPHVAEKDFAWGFWHYKPDYFVYLPDLDWALASIRADRGFDQQYRPVATLPGPGDTDFIIYARIHK